MYVFPELSGGLGNRFFQTAAALGYSEKYGHLPAFVKSYIHLNTEHPGSEDFFVFFPNIPIFDDIKDYEHIKHEDKVSELHMLPQNNNNVISEFVVLPYSPKHVRLTGLFQSLKFFPSYRIRPSILGYNDSPFIPCIFLHVRRGDYLLEKNAVLTINLSEYFRRALTDSVKPNINVLVCSDDINWCKTNLPVLYNDIVNNNQWKWFEGSDKDTLKIMSRCEYGGICSNSTFSWWGSYLNNSLKKKVYMPAKWFNPPMPQQPDIYPSYAIVLPV